MLYKQIIPAFFKIDPEEKIYKIFLYKNLIRVKYDHHFYYIDIIEENGEFYWQLTLYKNSYYTTIINDGSFERVLFAITEARDKKGENNGKN